MAVFLYITRKYKNGEPKTGEMTRVWGIKAVWKKVSKSVACFKQRKELSFAINLYRKCDSPIT